MMLENSNDDHFYVTLPSNSSFDVYGKQHPGAYKTTLERDVMVNPTEWEVGLTELMYSRTWFNVVNAKMLINIPDPKKDRYMESTVCHVPNKRYNSPQHLIDVWNDYLRTACNSGVELKYVKETGRCVIYVAPRHLVRLNAHACSILGFGDYKAVVIKGENGANEIPHPAGLNMLPKEDDVLQIYAHISESFLPVNLNRLINTLYVYSDVIEPQIVGDSYVPLLRSVVDNVGDRGEMASVSFTNVHYKNLSRGVFHDIEVNITDDTGRKIPFEGGRVTVKLHFKKKHL